MNDIPDSTLADIERLAGVKRIDKRRMEELREEVGVKESQEEPGEEPVKVDWTRGKNGRGTVDEESACAQTGY